MNFTKMHAAGNDYVYINCLKEKVENPSELAKSMSDRHFGIGSDGLILIKKGKSASFKMEMFNPDGTTSPMCGNGLRSVTKYLYDEKMTQDRKFDIETDAGLRTVEIISVDENNKAKYIRLNMSEPILNAKDIPIIWKSDTVINEKLPLHGHYWKFTAVSVGNPHCVIFIDDEEGLRNLNVNQYGREIASIDMFPEGININFVYVKNDSEIYQRTWERGADETLACGTGASASVVACILNGILDRKKQITVHLLGGDLKIEWSEIDNCVYLEGDAVRVFDGTWLL